ncbi:MAG: hypothetical protein PHU23_16515 [Dehalococcoidales bacterium]|nr:hypothetical protein [Dehalococcoidales bacterium]
MQESFQGDSKANPTKYGNLFFHHPVQEEFFGKYVRFEGGDQFNTPMSALYLIIRDDKSNSDTSHTHDFDEYLSFVGLDPDNPDYLGGEIEICLGEEQEKHYFNKSTSIYIPKGFKHLPLTFKKIYKPFMVVHLFLTPHYTKNE